MFKNRMRAFGRCENTKRGNRAAAEVLATLLPRLVPLPSPGLERNRTVRAVVAGRDQGAVAAVQAPGRSSSIALAG
jgi:hypothetical protein